LACHTKLTYGLVTQGAVLNGGAIRTAARPKTAAALRAARHPRHARSKHFYVFDKDHNIIINCKLITLFYQDPTPLTPVLVRSAVCNNTHFCFKNYNGIFYMSKILIFFHIIFSYYQ
jgi:hypothetical protein